MSKRKLVISIVVLVPVVVFLVVRFLNFDDDASIGSALSTSGYVELQPPSTLLMPGTWVSVLNSDPLHLGIVCTPLNALGLEDASELQYSSSAESDITSRLKDSFSFGSEALAKLKGSSRFSAVKSIAFRLRDVHVVELPDDVIMQGVRNRAEQCWEAIRFRYAGDRQLSMVKSVLIADAEYHVEYNQSLESATEAELKKQLALELDLRFGADENGLRKLVGKDLIWGIREDPRLALLGLELPPTGGRPREHTASVLSGKGAVTALSTSPIMRAEPEREVIAYDVPPLRQSSAMSCWATVYAMMRSWKDDTTWAANNVVAELGTPWDDFYLRDEGLPGGMEKSFVESIGMESEPPANYTASAYVDMLREYGPLWIVTGDGISAHARLLVGIYGTPHAEGITAYEQTTFEFIDPRSGAYQYENGLEFTLEFETEARWLVDGRFDNVEFRDQIIHWPQ